MTKLEAFCVQVGVLITLLGFGTALLSGVSISVDAKPYVDRILDVLLIVLSPAVLQTMIAKALGGSDEKTSSNSTP